MFPEHAAAGSRGNSAAQGGELYREETADSIATSITTTTTYVEGKDSKHAHQNCAQVKLPKSLSSARTSHFTLQPHVCASTQHCSANTKLTATLYHARTQDMTTHTHRIMTDE